MDSMMTRIRFRLVVCSICLLAVAGCTHSDKADNSASSEANQEQAESAQFAVQESDSKLREDALLSDWCVEHTVPESICTQCNPTLIDGYKKSGDWCGGHGLPESQCRKCNPEITFPQEKILESRRAEAGKSTELTVTDWCFEHGVPESRCTRCHLNLIDGFKKANDWCKEHGLPDSQCRRCNPEITFAQEKILESLRLEDAASEKVQVSLFFRPNKMICATDGAIIQFASSSTAQRAGISVQQVYSSTLESTVDAPAEVVFDEGQTYVVSSTVSALVVRWLISPGDMIRKGDELALLQSPEIAPLMTSLVSANVNFQVQTKEMARFEEMNKKHLVSAAEYDLQLARSEQSRAEMVSARGLLLSAGLDEHELDRIVKSGIVSNQFMLKAPVSGIATERVVQQGELAEPGRKFAQIANPHALWIEAQLSEAQMQEVQIGNKLVFGSDGKGLDRVGAEVIWKSNFLDLHSRTGTVRARVLDRHAEISAGQFGRVSIVAPANEHVVLVPKDAVQWEGCCNVVFVQETDQRYRPRKVMLTKGEGSYYQVTEGLSNGERIVVDGAFLLKTELKKSSLGAGCCAVEPAG
jgi:cobalt-zinc-cadmium efflux system membrane fusion protein